MKQSYLAILSGIILLLILTLSWCGRKPQLEYTGIPMQSPTATPGASAAPVAAPGASPQAASPTIAQSPSPELRKAAERSGPAVVLVSVFDEPGKLLRTGTGFFISEDGKLATNWHLVADAAHAVAKASGGGIYNVTGTLTQSEAADLAVLQAEVKKPVPFLSSGKAGGAQAGTRVAAIASRLARGVPPLFVATVSARTADENGERLELMPPPPNDMTGAPLINENGELLGLVTTHTGQAGSPNRVRTAGALDLLVAKIDPNTKPGFPGAGARSPSGSPTGAEVAGATPVATAQPTTRTVTTTTRTGKPKIVYDPKPAYPAYSYFHEQGSGRFRITFSAKGTVKNVEAVESTKSATLDNVTIEALRRWRATPGQEWNVVVPITFERRR